MLEFAISLVIVLTIVSLVYKVIVATKNAIVKVVNWVGAIITVTTRLVVISLLLVVFFQFFTSGIINHVVMLINYNLVR